MVAVLGSLFLELVQYVASGDGVLQCEDPAGPLESCCLPSQLQEQGLPSTAGGNFETLFT